MRISKESADPVRPYANLLPLVDELLAAGNHLVDEGFLLTQGGWECGLAQPIDFTLIRGKFALPSSIQLSEDLDSVLDRLTWCVILGPGARTLTSVLPPELPGGTG